MTEPDTIIARIQEIQEGLIGSMTALRDLTESVDHKALAYFAPGIRPILDGISAASSACVDLANTVTLREIEKAIDRVLLDDPPTTDEGSQP